MNKPEMILFDYGRTLLYQPGFNTSNGNRAIYPYISENRQNITFEEYDRTIIDLFSKIKAERGSVLEALFDRLLPGNQFEFVLASSDYLFRKPNRLMFEIALQKAGLSADKVWYCGDSIEADVYGARNVGIFPVLYEGTTPDHVDPFAHQNDGLEIDFEYLHIHDWREIIAVLEGIG